MSRGRSMQAQDDPTAQTQAASRSDRASKWLRVPLIVAALPVVRLLWLMAIAHRLRDIFSLQGLRYAALIVFTVVVGGGVIFVAVEPGQDLSAWDGLWWAAETVTTVAYGDIYPTTALGRIVATVVMTVGIGFVALLTGWPSASCTAGAKMQPT